MGIVRYAPNNTPRFDHDPATGESLGLLIEESRTNLFTYSNFSQSTSTSLPTGWHGWNPATFLTSQTLSPDGVDYGVFHGAVNQNGGGLRKDITGLVAGGTYYVTYYVRGLTSTELTYFTNNNARGTTTGTADGAQNVSWFAATQVKIDCNNLNGTGASIGGGNQISLTQDWQRFGTTIVADNAGSARIIISNNVQDTGTGNEDGGGTFLIWGAQLELGSFATSYIPTSGSTVTRAADIPKIEGTNLTSFYNDTEGTVFAEYQNLKTGDTNGRVWDIGNNQNQTLVINAASSTTVQGQFYNSSGNGYEYNPGAVSATNAFNKVALGMKNNDTNLCVNGTLGTDDTSVTLIDFSSAGTFSIGRSEYYSPRELNGCVRRLSYYNKRLPNAQLQGLTQQ